MGWPEITLMLLSAIGFGVNIVKHGDTTHYNIFITIVAMAIQYFLLYMGGFFN